MKVYPLKFHKNGNIWVVPHTSQTTARQDLKDKLDEFEASDNPDPNKAPCLLDPVDYPLNKTGITMAFKDAQVFIQKK